MRAVTGLPLLLIAAACAGCLDADAPGDAADTMAVNEFPPSPAGTIRFLVMGDSGTGEEPQYEVAAAMHAVCLERGCDFVLGNGDNIYEDGPTAGAYDEQFESKFEQPYAIFPDIPFWMVLGNHDNGDGAGSDPTVGDAEVAYAARTDRVSEKWQMPARWYTFTQLDGAVEFFALDSGPAETAMSPVWLPTRLGSQQDAWMDGAMAASSAAWKFAFAHHPYISNGQHGDAGVFDGIPAAGLAWGQFIERHVCGSVDVFFAGHDHDLQWHESAPGCDKTQFIISGAAAKQRSQGNDERPALFEAYDTYGFLWVEVTDDDFLGVFYDGAGDKLYERSFQRHGA